ncbi:GntR family transcriptional regulator [Spongiactinospora rosea]|nr:GntR family transcriptional regulator [Spongiactinospora rosea]
MSVTPMYVVVADRISAQIAAGELRPGDRIPGERELEELYKISRNVARAVISRLRQQGLIVSRQGKGSFVANRDLIRRLVRNGQEFRPADNTEVDQTLTVELSEVDASNDIAWCLDLSLPARVSKALMTWTIGNEPIEVTEHYERLLDQPPITRPETNPMNAPDVIKRFASIGTQVTTVEEDTSARMPTSEETHQMAIPQGVPVITVERTHHAGDTPVAISRITIRADRVLISSKQDISAG